ncbi:MAG: hypothetical protein VB017_01055 [Endomicrobiaceae bacterium]|jgi:ABC-type dipeptide/oligopeptide/nickel transport system permease component|nr:hypothetical protein [Endomicrobiaceae bacterium]
MTFEIIAGIVLLIINIPFGWFGMLWLGYYGKKTGKKIYYFLSAAVYVLSWVMMAAGFYLCGKEYAGVIMQYIKHYIYPAVILITAVFAIILIMRKRNKNNKEEIK